MERTARGESNESRFAAGRGAREICGGNSFAKVAPPPPSSELAHLAPDHCHASRRPPASVVSGAGELSSLLPLMMVMGLDVALAQPRQECIFLSPSSLA